MRFILVVDRKHLFPRISPQGLLPCDAVDLRAVEAHAFFAERDYMERCSHYKQLIPYIAVVHGEQVLCYQRHAGHTETRLGGLWTVGFGGHIEPLDRAAPEIHEGGLLLTAALRELHEETGIVARPGDLQLLGYINSEREEVSSVHFGVLMQVDVARQGLDPSVLAQQVMAQAEPFRVAWRSRRQLADVGPGGQSPPAPEEGRWEDWTLLALPALASRR